MDANSRYVRRAELHITEKIVVQPQRVGTDISVTEVLLKATHRHQLHLLPWHSRGDIRLQAI